MTRRPAVQQPPLSAQLSASLSMRHVVVAIGWNLPRYGITVICCGDISRSEKGGVMDPDVMNLGICPATLLVDAMAAQPADITAAAAAAVDAGFFEASVWSFQLDSF